MDFLDEMHRTVRKLCTPGKGILAADESTGTMGKRLATIALDNTLANRTAYRRLLFTTDDLEKNISGVITYEETLKNRALVEPLFKKGLVVGIKTDLGARPLYGTRGETVTQGLDFLDDRCATYYGLGARFAKWRGVLKITKDGCPSTLAIEANAQALARYASISQQHGLVPIVEPEILMDGDHSLATSKAVTEKVLSAVYRALVEHHVVLSATLLKPNMVRPGVSHATEVPDAAIARATVEALSNAVPPSVPGIVFLSGGMSETQASRVLNAINVVVAPTPWYLSFSYGRALQASVLQAWQGSDDHVAAAQDALRTRANANGLATLGAYAGEVAVREGVASLHVSNYTY